MKRLSAMPWGRDLIGHRVASTPNGRSYGINGHVPCDHVAVFEYPDCTRTFNGREWGVKGKEREGGQ